MIDYHKITSPVDNICLPLLQEIERRHKRDPAKREAEMDNLDIKLQTKQVRPFIKKNTATPQFCGVFLLVWVSDLTVKDF